MVMSPPPLDDTNYNVHILEFREDADHRLMNDDVLCLFQITFENQERRADVKDKFRVMWTPKVATRDRILFHLRAADPCRTRVCTLSVNNIVWNQLDTTLQWHIEQMIRDHPGHIQVISVDTAVHQMCDVNQADNWGRFWTVADSGYLLAIALGPPCETWSAARHEPAG